jgi:hypothetical protein
VSTLPGPQHWAALPETVPLLRLTVPKSLSMPPPYFAALVVRLKLLRVLVEFELLKRAPPWPAVQPVTVSPLALSRAPLKIPPPPSPRNVLVAWPPEIVTPVRVREGVLPLVASMLNTPPPCSATQPTSDTFVSVRIASL